MSVALRESESENKADQIEKEYEDFAYIVSHDLNAPLRHVKEFTRLLLGGRKSDLTDEEREYVRFLEKSLVKLDDMQQALLTFSRLNTQAGQMRETDFNQSIKTAIKALDKRIKIYNPEIKYDNLPTVKAEPKQIELLFYHLIDNALKFYNGSVPEQKIEITAKDKGLVWLFEVRDNGIGIAKEYWQEVFRLFRRLEPDKYQGIGAGLGICRKIVQRHGGDIYIESEEGKGTSLFFTINKSV